MSKLHEIFPTLIYQAPLMAKTATYNRLNLDLKREVGFFLKEDELGIKWSAANYRHGYTSYGSRDRIFDYSGNFSTLGKYLDRHVANYLKQLNYSVGKNDLGLTSMWVNCMPKGSYHTNHIHPLSVISGTYYLVTDAKSGAIKFEDSRMSKFMNSPQPRQKAPPSRQRYYQIQPKIGDVVLFESWQGHEVLENKSNSNRVSVSFNYGWL